MTISAYVVFLLGVWPLCLTPTVAQDDGGFLTGQTDVAELDQDASAFLARRADVGEPGQATSAEHLDVVVTKHESYLDQVKKSAIAAVLGVVLVILAFPVIWYNEKREVHMEKVFGYARKILKPDVGSEKVDERNEGCLVHMQGVTACDETLTDRNFPGVCFTNCAKSKRKVEMYQWVEHSETHERDAPGGGKEKVTKYTYSKEWVGRHIDASSFHESGYKNPPFPFDSEEQIAKDVAFGAFRLTTSLIKQMCDWQAATAHELPNTCIAGGLSFTLRDGIYKTSSASFPEIGDMKVTFTKVPCGDATVLALQHTNSFMELNYARVPQGTGCMPWSQVPDKLDLSQPLLPTRSMKALEDEMNPCACVGRLIESGESLNELVEEHLSARQIMSRAENKQHLIHIGLVALGFCMFFFGFLLQFMFVPTLFRIIPLAGTWIQYFGNVIAYMAAFSCGCFCWCSTLAYSWLFSRPVRALLFFSFAVLMVAVPTYLADEKCKTC